MELRFASSNPFKVREAQEILAAAGVGVRPVDLKLEELQTDDLERLVRDKVLKAFAAVGRPVFVEHTGLFVSGLNGLPGGLTRFILEGLKAEGFAAWASQCEDATARARTLIGYCNAKTIRFFEGGIEGTVVAPPRGIREFQWDCVFVPKGEVSTFAEMTRERKNEISMRRHALALLAGFLNGQEA